MNNNGYVLTFILIMTATVAVLLTGLREATKEGAARNEDIFNKRAILTAIEDKLDGSVKGMSDEDVIQVFESDMQQIVLDMEGNVVEGKKAEDINMAVERKKPEPNRMLPLYIYEGDGNKTYILSVRGSGLWDEIWGTIALENDINTIAGAAFDHAGETPGLGAEIKDNPKFSTQFKGKKIYDDSEFVSVDVVKGGAPTGAEHAVDGISGATVTADGVEEMLYRGIQYYEPYLSQLKQSSMVLEPAQ